MKHAAHFIHHADHLRHKAHDWLILVVVIANVPSLIHESWDIALEFIHHITGGG